MPQRFAEPGLRLSRRPQILIVAAFTPYLGIPLSLRYEHLIVYGLFLMMLLGGAGLGYAGWQARRLVVPWVIVGALVTLNVILGFSSTSILTDFRVLERIIRTGDSFLLQAAAALVALGAMSRTPGGSRRQIRVAASTFVLLMYANTVLILVFDPANIEFLLRQFWTNPAGAEVRGWTSVAARELTAGRFGGIFNQPFDGGLSYSLALACWWYMYKNKFERGFVSTAIPMFGLGLLLVGGLSTGSKVFLAAILLISGQILASRSGGLGNALPRNLRLTVVAGAGTLVVVAIEVADLQRFWGFVGAIGSDTQAVTGGRFRSLGEYWNQILGDLSLLGSQSFYTDDALRSYLIRGGIVGLLLVMLVYREFFRIGQRLPRRSPERWLAFGLTSITLAASFGSVSLQTIRASSVFWILMALLLGHALNLRRSAIGGTSRTTETSSEDRSLGVRGQPFRRGASD